MMTTTTDPWAEYLSLSEWDRMTLVVELTSLWPAGAVEEFERLGLIRETTPLPAMHCSECSSEPAHDIVWIEHPRTGETIAIRPCSQCGPEQIPLEDLRRWTIEWSGLVAFLADSLEAKGGTTELVPDRLWRLGKTRWAGRPTTLFYGRAVHRHDAAEVLAEVEQSTSAVLFFPKRPLTIPTRNPAVPLELVCAWNGDSLEFDYEYASAQARGKPAETSGIRPRRDGNRAAVKQRLKLELDAHLTAACDHARSAIESGREPTLLPCPTRADLARRCESSPATVTRCFDEDQELQQRWHHAHDLLRIIGSYTE